MEQIEVVTIQQMKDTLAKEAGSKFPLKITLKNGEVIIRYVRGFADQQSNILLISDGWRLPGRRSLCLPRIGVAP